MAKPRKIYVHEKALAHLSRGLYRSPASALRELVSNAWDANARTVQIGTNYPNFYQIVVQDNGDGFAKEEFVRLMAGNIGNSQKRPKDEPLINGRPTIGRLGIGMLGIAQICGSFKITSRPKNGEPFTARIRLYDLLRERIDVDDPELVRDTAISSSSDVVEVEETVTEVDVGEYTFEPYEQIGEETGTRILADDVHPTFSESFKQSMNAEKFQQPPLDWRDAIVIMSHVHSLQQLGDYWKLLWELAASCPIPYIAANALPNGSIKNEQAQLKKYDFRLFVDGIELSKPIYLQGNPGGYTTRRIGSQHRRIYARDLRFHGYVVVQEGRQLQPDELRGIMIRIKNVGIGYYDPSMLDYRFNQGPRSRWVTGEIFVDDGLEDALNIDRDSFNRFHPQFRAVQQYVHKVLEEEIFPEVYKNIEIRSREKASDRSAKRQLSLAQVIADVTGADVEVTEASSKDGMDGFPKITWKGDNLRIQLPPTQTIETRKAHRQLAGSMLALYELATQERTRTGQRQRFSELILELFRKW
jgi:Histidine kinase-, DNA gyrase B-, and HSP90-like ATPase